MLCDELYDQSERARWTLGDLDWQTLDRDAVTPELLAFVRSVAISELPTFTASRRFLHEFADDLDFTQWISVWFYEETRHPRVLMRWLERFGVTIDEATMLRGRITTPFMRSRAATLVNNVISEVVASHSYARLSRSCAEPVLSQIAHHLATDEARHATGFHAYAKRAMVTADDRIAAIKVLHAWLTNSATIEHPVKQIHERLGDAPLDRNAVRRRVCHLVSELVGKTLNDEDEMIAGMRELSA